MAFHNNVLSPILLVLILISAGAKMCESARVFTIINDCKETIWPAVTPGENFNGGGFTLKPKQSIVFTAPVSWSGRIWGRTGCNFDKNGNGSCQTGGSGNSFKLVVTPINGKGNCSIAGCDSDLNPSCPSELSIKSNGKVVGCRSACDVFNTDEYCCRGLYGNPRVCQPTYYSKKFKEACPVAYSYAYDDSTSVFTCTGTDYVIAFCSSRKQPVCTYHNNKLVCNTNGSKGLKSLIGRWWGLMLASMLMVNLWTIS
ncbi:hypothetical protein ACB094_12G126800 [Castanea mollissima]